MRSASEFLQFPLHLLEVGVDVGEDGGEGGEEVVQLLPQWLHHAAHEPDLVLVHALYRANLEGLGDLVAAPPLLAGDLAELVAEEGAPGDVGLVAAAGVADIAGVEDLLDYCLSQWLVTHLCSLFRLRSKPALCLRSLSFSRLLLWKAMSVLRMRLVIIFFALSRFLLISTKLRSQFSSSTLHRCLRCMFSSTDPFSDSLASSEPLFISKPFEEPSALRGEYCG